MAAPLIPWEPCNFPEQLQSELNRRKVNRNLVYIHGEKGGWQSDSGEWEKYRGPMTPWVRFCSNGFGREFEDDGVTPLPASKIKPGFVFFGGKDFYSGYGFKKSNNDIAEEIIGYLPDTGTPHIIENDLKTSHYPIHVPAPEIEKVTVTIQKELYRRASIDWVCFSKKQLEYMTPYFLVPGITCILEWGWNHFDPQSLLNLADINGLKNFNNNPYPLYTDHILKSRGNYDVIFGKITHFEWSTEGNKIKCKTEITSQDRIYSGLIIDASAVNITTGKGSEEDVKPLDNLPEFIDNVLTKFKDVVNTDPRLIPQLADFTNYLIKYHPDNWKEYAYGVFWGRDLSNVSPFKKGNAKEDFDRKNPNGPMWINLGLLVEIMNYHSAPATGFKGKELFRIDIDDVVISGHPNLISTDGTVLLIPNYEAPHYHAGNYGALAADEKEYDAMLNATNPPIVIGKRADAEKQGKLADWKVNKVCKQFKSACFRDNHDEVINWVRYLRSGSNNTFEFPFKKDVIGDAKSKPYPRRYSGYIKNLYFNVDKLKTLTSKNAGIKTYPKLLEKILDEINKAAGNFWDFRLVGGWGKQGLAATDQATMKIVDNRFISTINRGPIYTFDYFDADSLLQGMSFKPTLSNAQAIRTIYSQTNNPDKKTTLTNGENELLDYKFRDRLMIDEDKKNVFPRKPTTARFDETMRELQTVSPKDGVYQVSNESDKRYIRRLVLPSPDVLKLLLDDGDEEHNPKYTGIMPGIQASFTIQGIGGLRTFMMFLVRNLPEPYSQKNVVFRIVDLQEAIENGKWTTTITAGVIPLREQIKKRLGINS
jgi:hypothetical protein